MSRHATALALSSYLDGELGLGAARALERHLEECPQCREELHALRSLSTELAAMTPYTPSPVLTSELRLRLARVERADPWLQQFEGSLRRWTLGSALLPLFASLVAIAMIVFLLIDSLPRPSLDGPAVAAADTEATIIRRVAGGRVFEEEASVWVEVGGSGKPDVELDLRARDVPEELLAFDGIGDTVQILIGAERLRIRFR